MATFKPSHSDHLIIEAAGKKTAYLKRDVFAAFNSSLLGLGDITREAQAVDAMAAVFDLQGFTNFCKQIEPHLSVPLFLSEFLKWLMDELKTEMMKEERAEGVSLWCPLPFLVKFMGDGLLVLWDSSKMTSVGRRNVIVSTMQICEHYRARFLPSIQLKVVDPPLVLRCGVARGTVYSVGDGNDYVGSCINMASRLQKLHGLTFVFNRRGIDLEDGGAADFFKSGIVVRQVAIRGIGENELVALLKSEYDTLSQTDREQFRMI